MHTKLSVLMCAFNEEQTIVRAVREVLGVSYPCDMELIVVDDGSTDDTAKLLAQLGDPRVIIRNHPRNRGKGAGLITAVSAATGTYILPFDADLEYVPQDIPKLLAPVLQGRVYVVYGVRLFGYRTVYQTYRYAVGNRLLTALANRLFNSYLSDLHTCLKLMPLDLFKRLRLSEPGFGLDTELTASLLRHGIQPFEVPVSYYGRSRAEGKKITWRDAVKCVWILLRVRTARSSRLLSEALTEASADLPQGSPGEVARCDLAPVPAFDPAGSGNAVMPAPGQLRMARS
jgi:dolichol-phosphate hexosyltransferase